MLGLRQALLFSVGVVSIPKTHIRVFEFETYLTIPVRSRFRNTETHST